jgi:Amt family ammonium transporter
MVWGGGYLGATLGELDFAGGSAVHINAGSAALALAIVLGRRVGWPKESFRPHNVPFVELGAGLLWFGWFGFNAGSELTADNIAALAFVNTQVATAAALLGWILVEWIKNGRPTLVGASSGAVAGLVAITPACAYIAPYAAALLGIVAGIVCALAVGLKYKLGFDDSLDVVGVHFVGGWIGCLWIGFFATLQSGVALAHEGLFYGGGAHQLVAQAEGAGIVTVWSFVVALVIGYLVKFTIGLRVKRDAEIDGIDVSEHAESAYDFTSASGGGGGAFAQAGIAVSSSGGAHSADSKPAQPANV